MSKRPLQLIASLIAAVWLLCPVAFAEPESQPPPRPARTTLRSN